MPLISYRCVQAWGVDWQPCTVVRTCIQLAMVERAAIGLFEKYILPISTVFDNSMFWCYD